MKLSVVIPAHNEESLIAQCLQAVQKEVAKTEEEVEVIVVNNASTDRTKEIAQSFRGVRVVDEPHKGLVRARHAGYTASSGELIANIDADTMPPEGWLATVFKEFDADPKLVALSGPFIYHDLSLFQRILVRVFYYVGYALYLLYHYVLRIGAMLQGGNFVLRRSALEKIGGFDTSIEFYGEDTDIAKRMSKIGKVKWTFKLPMYASGRRLKEEGILTMGFKYALNFFTVTFRGKPHTKHYKDIRTPYSLENNKEKE